MISRKLSSVLPRIYINHCFMLKKLNCSKVKNNKQKMNTRIKLKSIYLVSPKLRAEGDIESGVSLLTNSFSNAGCRKAVNVSAAAATPGVFENISDTSPSMNPIVSDVQRAVLLGIVMMTYTSSNGVATPNKWMLFSTIT